MKSWLSFLLPNDEYKEKKLLYFLAEGAVILLLALMFIFISSRYVTFFQIDVEFALFLSVALFFTYVLIRYIWSGLEYTDVATTRSYKNELKHIWWRSITFTIIFIVVYLMFGNVPNQKSEWLELILLPLLAGVLWFLMSYLSLRKSYKKNKDLL